MRIVVALGGNALIKEGQKGDVYQQFANTRESMKDIVKLIKDGHEVIITHGNGPQVGNILRRVEVAKDEAYYVPLGVCVAESQGEIGYMISQTLRNALDREVACVLTQVVVDKDDNSIKNPTKPIGKYFTKRQAEFLRKHEQVDAVFKEIPGKGYRRVVPSPIPKDIVEKETIKKMMKDGVVVVACGGGGMPVYYKGRKLEGIDGVVDKDLSSALLAKEVKADVLAILTDVENVYRNFGKKNQEKIAKINRNYAMKLLEEGEFGEGSMKPKVQAAVNFLDNPKKKAIITGKDKLIEAIKGKRGTTITL